MWDLSLGLPFGRMSRRNVFLFATSLIVATFAYILLLSPITHAATNAEWVGGAITYNSNQYTKQADAQNGAGTSLPAGTHIYTFLEPQAAGSTAPQKVDVIYFAPGVEPSKATSASYAVYTFTPPSTFTNPTNQQTIGLTAQTAASQKTTSCDGTFTMGIGWIVCPVTNFLASAMDWLFQILSSFLTVRPVQTTQENSLFRAWSYMRNFANIAFVIAFLVLIYSQITNIGLSAYNIKKMLPRLIIAAILVNISYWICAIAIDISNILGYSIQDIFISLRNGIVGANGNGWSVISWKSIASFILASGVGATAASIGIYVAIGGAVGGAIYMLVPILLGVLMAALVAILVLAARQAIITILVIISPLAFVAYILPNTEKYFKKWHELGMTMLLVFPAFSVVFGGSQLAGSAIIQNADTINLILLGMAVQIAPVAITPLLLRVSGNLLTRFAGMVNNPNKGMLDRTRNWAKERADQHKSRVLANPATRRRDFLARATQAIDRKDRTRKGWQAANNSMADAKWANDHKYHTIHNASEEAKMLKETGEAVSQAAFEKLRTTPNHRVQLQDVNYRVAHLNVDVAKAEAEAQWENLRVSDKADNLNTIPSHLTQQARAAQQQTLGAAIVASQIKSAKHEQQQEFAAELLASDVLQDQAGGISAHGADSALASAITAQRKAYGESVVEAGQIIKHLNLSGVQRQKLAMGELVEVRDDTGKIIKTFSESSTYAREAAIEAQLKGGGNFENIEQIIINSGSKLSEFKTTISNGIVENRLAEKGVYLGGKTIDEVAQGKITDEASLNVSVARTIAQGKIKPVQLATMDKDAVNRVLQVAISRNTAGLSAEDAAQLAIQTKILAASAKEALTSTSLRGNISQNARPLLERMQNL